MTRPALKFDVLLLNVPNQFPDYDAVVLAQDIRPEKPSLTLKASWTRGDTETIRAIPVQVTETSSTGLAWLNPIRSIAWSEDKSYGIIGDPKSADEFGLIQFGLIADKVIRFEYGAEKPRKTEERPGKLSGQSPLGRTVTGTARYRIDEAEAKAVEGKPVEASASSKSEAKAVEGERNPYGMHMSIDSKAISTSPDPK